mmetsp:Transcript_12663/g.32539  ORF Transcript_12663/g.32539 Transcript_12663/m.32539 type:complete len:261 (-) Transcript_12663:29-811(-)
MQRRGCIPSPSLARTRALRRASPGQRSAGAEPVDTRSRPSLPPGRIAPWMAGAPPPWQRVAQAARRSQPPRSSRCRAVVQAPPHLHRPARRLHPSSGAAALCLGGRRRRSREANPPTTPSRFPRKCARARRAAPAGGAPPEPTRASPPRPGAPGTPRPAAPTHAPPQTARSWAAWPTCARAAPSRPCPASAPSLSTRCVGIRAQGAGPRRPDPRASPARTRTPSGCSSRVRTRSAAPPRRVGTCARAASAPPHQRRRPAL